MQWWGGCKRKTVINAGGRKSAPKARDGWFKVTVAVEVNVKVTAVMPVYFTPRSHPWLCPSFHPRCRGWNVTKLNCSQAPFAASARHCLGLLSSFQSLSLFSSQAVLSKSPFGCAKVCVSMCVSWSIVPFSQSFLMPVGRELPRFRVCGAVWQLQFIQTWARGDKGEKSH